ncbi:hypothetical protein QP228_000125 [Pseudoglutamicibacter cumminsii]|uniref:hypothetical protein n=1 Tax=Pseudoglutamicibacter cumminsii TaxID=156979 RepID=UPI002AB8C652|nr:hypothetical protein [Pseudoglutamicibacter cumminsii]MDZ3744441.1 hypothetical protein [Pseudoglutamicibacter cumminsii]
MTKPTDLTHIHSFLDEIRGEEALAWAAERTQATDARLASDEHDRVVARIQEAMDAEDRLIAVSKHGEFHTNFWQDAEHPRGIWRTTDWDSYIAGDPQWETLLDLDELSADEGVNWVWRGASWEPKPGGTRGERWWCSPLMVVTRWWSASSMRWIASSLTAAWSCRWRRRP